MNIVLLASGSRGDVQPYVALGKGLLQAGHAVRLLTSPDFQSLVAAHGLEFVPVGGSTEQVAQSMQALVEAGNMLKILASMGQSARELAVQFAAAGLAACQDADLLIGGFSGLFVGLALSEKLGIPLLQAYLTPMTPTRDFPGVLMPAAPLPLPAMFNGLSHRLTQQMLWQSFRGADNKARAEVLQMPPAPFWGPFGALRQRAAPVLYGYSPTVVPPPKDWPGFVTVTGYWLLDPPAGWQPPADLVNFLQAGPPPVYIGFGSMTSSKPAETAELVLGALARAGQRGILSAGWGGLTKADLPSSVFAVGSLPHSWLLPQMAAVVHHG
ncbi:MAG: glycosyltransferase, partial [Anaerolineales bacterium]